MATTTNLGLIQPTVGGDTDAWGGYLNSDLGYIDALFGIAGTSVTLHVNNQNISSSSHKFDQIKMGDDRPLQFGAAPDYWLVYNSSGTQFELRGTNVDGSGTDGLILKVADGTDDVAFTGQIQGASGVIAGTAISVGGDTTSGFYRGGPNIVNLSNAGALTASFDASNVSTIQKLSVAGDGATVTGIKDEDNMSSNSATKLATQQSIKAYVDAQVGSFDTLAEVLAAGNITGSTDIVVTSGQEITTNTISETTGASGVTIDSVLVKDSTVTASGGFVGNATTASSSPAGALTGTTLKSTVVSSSLTSVGTIATGVWNGTAVAPGFGGTGLSSYSAGDILYATGSSTLAKLAKGSDTQVLTLASGLPSWVAPTVGDITGITAGTGLSGTDLTGPVPTLNVDASQTQITAVGTIGTGTWSATTIAVNKGGSGLTSYTAGDLLYATGSTTLAKLAKQTDGQVLTLASGLPSWATPTVGDLTAIVAGSGLTGSALSGPIPTLNVIGTADKITVSADAVTIASSYIGQSSITTLGTVGTGVWNGTPVATAYIADNAVTLAKLEHGTQGDILYYGASGTPARLGTGSDGQVLTSGGSGANPAWETPTTGDITGITAGTGLSGTNLTGPVPTLNVEASQTQITALGTIGTGTWQATKVASAYLDDDTAHLSTAQSFTGAKTFDEVLTAEKTVYVNDTANAKMTLGLTVNQGAADDEILAFKSSDVNQPSTNYAEADTFGFVSKTAGATGGLKFGAFTETGVASRTCYYYVVNADDADATKSTSGEGLYQIDLALNNGTGSKVVNADGNMVAFTSNGNARFFFQADGTGYADVAWTTFSDSRLKTDVAAIPYGLASVRSVEAKIFDKWSGKIDAAGDVILEDGSDLRMIGFIAQDVKAAMPELVPDLQDDKSFYSLDYGRMTPVLWAATKELDDTVESLKARIEALEAQV